MEPLNQPPRRKLQHDSRARRIGTLEQRVNETTESLLELVLALQALALTLKAPESYRVQLDQLAERIYRVTWAASAEAAPAQGDGDGARSELSG